MIYLFLFQMLFAATKVDFETGLRLENNVFYRDQAAEPDLSLFLKPEVLLYKDSNKINLFAHLNTEYGKYISFAELDYLDYDAAIGFMLQVNKKTKMGLSADYANITEPSQFENQEIFQRQEIKANYRAEYRQSDLTNHYLDIYALMTDYTESEFRYMVGQKIGVDFETEYFFLPETAFLVQFSADQMVYPDGRINDTLTGTQYLNDSLGYKIAGGFEGRLTEYSLFYFTFGYYVRDYEFDDDFNEPVFEVSFEEQITPQDTLTAGYLYELVDSAYTNYELNQQMYLAYSRVFGDRFILLFKSNYLYKSFSNPVKREDQKLFGTVQVDYSYKPNWLIKAGFSGDILLSDAYDTRPESRGDRASSYQVYQLYLATKVFF